MTRAPAGLAAACHCELASTTTSKFGPWDIAACMPTRHDDGARGAGAFAKECRVTVTGPEGAMGDRAAWEERRGFVDFYRQEGFQLESGRTRNGSNGSPPHHLAATLSLRLPQPSVPATVPAARM